jgi:hypothetical protein
VPELDPLPLGEVSVGSTALDRLLKVVLWWMASESNPDSAVYGLITVGAVIATESAHAFDPWREVLAVTVVLVLYWLAHAYSTLLGSRYTEGAVLNLSKISEVGYHEFAVFRGAALPIVAMAVAAAVGAGANVVDIAGLATVIAVLLVFELAAGLRSRLSGPMMLLQLAIGAGFGLVIVSVRTILG